MRSVPWLVLLLAGCAAEARREPPPAAPDSTSGSAAVPTSTVSSTSTSTGMSEKCIVVGATGVAEGVLHGAGSGLFTLRLTRPRCIVGLPRAGFVTEIAVATAGPDLRPLLDARVRLGGDVIAGENDMGGPAVVLLAKDVERVVPPAGDP